MRRHPDKYNALVKNGTWILVPRPSDVNLVRSMWLFKHKFHADGTLSRYKARLIANGSNQQHGVDFDKTFSPVVKHWPPFATFLALLFRHVAYSPTCVTHSIFLRCSLNGFENRHPSCLFQRFARLCHSAGILTALPPVHFIPIKKYARQLLERAHMVNCNPSRTQINTDSKLGLDGVPGTLELVSSFISSATTSLVGYTDADWAGCPSTRRSTSGYCVFLGDNLLLWSAKRQHTISCSSIEAEYRGVANVVAETAWIRNLLHELHSSLLTATLVYCDNVSAVYMSANPVQHQRTKHIEIDIHFVCDIVKAGHVRVLHVPSRFQYADIFTKGLPSALFEDFRSSLSVRHTPALTARAY
ncbi:ribonuclease H-like domain-containing protein [Tanacetum coccineum]|uniref:Ribonuclease H-like domain-containing protein n=1 Tax=Tanacetum coccineum TaxID=301880 RepID=A0ABQ5FDD0_9ASTR